MDGTLRWISQSREDQVDVTLLKLFSGKSKYKERRPKTSKNGQEEALQGQTHHSRF